jgi:hypothetical protein
VQHALSDDTKSRNSLMSFCFSFLDKNPKIWYNIYRLKEKELKL